MPYTIHHSMGICYEEIGEGKPPGVIHCRGLIGGIDAEASALLTSWLEIESDFAGAKKWAGFQMRKSPDL